MTILALLFTLIINPPTSQAGFSITGSIRDQTGRSVDTSIRVSLLDDNYQQIKSVFSYGGRYKFTGVRSGAYYVKAETLGTPFEEQMSPRIEAISGRIRGGGLEAFYFDLVLRFKKAPTKATSPGVIFTQTVPEGARAEY